MAGKVGKPLTALSTVYPLAVEDSKSEVAWTNAFGPALGGVWR